MSNYQNYQNYKKPTINLSASGLALTGADILGPFYRPGAPFRTKLVDTPTLFLAGKVLDQQGTPVDGAYVDFWQADEHGKYDEDGPGFRGIQQVGWQGIYKLETVHPGAYDISNPNDPQPHDFRCSHIHAKIWVNGVDVLTTQLYFAGDPYDATDHWFDPAREIKFSSPGVGEFYFIVKT